jgi:signal transduction histidine kinase
MSAGGTLTIVTALERCGGKDCGHIRVRDTGPGISAEQMKYIFVPFYTTKTQGTGLGLAICRKLMEQQGGGITVSSQPGEGTEFIIELPVYNGESPFSKEDNCAPT